MNSEVLNFIASKNDEFKDLKDMGEGVWRFSYEARGGKIAEIFLDLSDDPVVSSESLLKKQQSIVEYDFYNTQGSLQWNFYYYYVLSDNNYENIKNTDIKLKVESDPSFSRKKIVNQKSLLKQYPFLSIIEKASKVDGQFRDISSEWVRVLKEYQLDGVYLEKQTYDDVISRYLSSNPLLDDGKGELSIKDEINTIIPGPIEHLNVDDKFRTHAAGTSYKFSQVNLIEGVNGVGKTSLLEALELVMCGKSFRQKDLAIEEASISLKYSNIMEPESFDPRNTKKFKARERDWYGAPAISPQSNLHNSFNRFNFFNTDASYRLANDKEPSEILKNFEALSLGGRTTELWRKISRFSDLFQKEQKNLKNEIVAIEDETRKDKKNLEQINSKKYSAPIDIERINSVLDIIGIGRFETNNIESAHSAISMVSFIQEYLNNILQMFSKNSVVSFDFIRSEQNRIENLQEDLHSYERLRSEKRNAMERNILKGKAVSDRFDRIKRLVEYVNAGEALNIKSISEEINKLSEKVSSFQAALSTVKYNDYFPQRDGINLDLNSEIISLRYKVESLTKDVEVENTKIKDAKESVEAVRAVVSQIKGLGRRFLDLSKDEKCPLCETVLDRLSLENGINHLVANVDNLSDLYEKRSKIEADLIMSKEMYASLERLKMAVNAITKSSDSFPINVAKQKVADAILEMEKAKSDLQVKKSKLESLVAQGFSFEELFDLFQIFKLNAGIRNDELRKFTELQVEVLNKALGELREFHRTMEKECEELDLSFIDGIVKQMNFETINDFKRFVEESLHRLVAVQPIIQKLKDSFNIESNVNLRPLFADVNSVYSELKNYIKYLVDVEGDKKIITTIQGQIDKRNEILVNKKSRYLNASRAIEAFNLIKTDYSKDNAVSEFFKQNKSTIMEIFKAIHLPQEFNDIYIDEKEIYLSKGLNKRELSRISTGQRSALALSIFLGLHLSCPKAPRIILFDDPIAFVDDLNVLAFLDFLRELNISGKRQIFFATANKKLSNLFKRKFDLLGEDFKVVPL